MGMEQGEEMSKKKDSDIVMIPVTAGTRKKLIQMKLDLVNGGTYEELMLKFVNEKGY